MKAYFCEVCAGIGEHFGDAGSHLFIEDEEPHFFAAAVRDCGYDLDVGFFDGVNVFEGLFVVGECQPDGVVGFPFGGHAVSAFFRGFGQVFR